ncbi:bifunctional 3,4-dihydroxy-2-butanone-4-phosphate synthase/GTP cyclohydrolase II [Cellulomonas fimi]|uniref:Multifunctional fusion protein n=1 Tax=Cellulomonas fimi (strain ATCC 484 / DSM 20113 / JCM 1341 / CCUG 24087 / LMG 16345 / NBRC 15513 / NCIMB 8980 / NCTC 7547 / NRS-133) TaxID=590998 RepID=F4GZP9_CELFA|nr:bifunctional 3,4-dihydroxy-2-butanone-4-phosphate synthase/GTP cyclohydrolase II [Cellulomonas fimi]AEE46093.1 GTP cyclohydrolase II [Cellulomonas fimi ATCC 484]NNH06944.1 bifunctional 3,4-dihydroxy-2-butanone-4-phosphate synthase/GTP cyclohydrolase II [Cellulomonas fimi]VEH31601.1 Riboflavin biosynthesis protein ribBA [Cellulomonas fimi]
MSDVRLGTVEDALDALRAGRPVLVADSPDRENEADVILAAQSATPEWIAWTIRHSSGYLCAPMPAARADALDLPLMVPHSQDPRRTAYTVTVDAATGVTTGISAADRARTLRVLADPASGHQDLIRPGHVLPLRAVPGGVLHRAGHTEAAVDLCRLAGLEPVGAIAELVDDDGTMTRLPGASALAAADGLVLLTIEDIVAWRTAHDDVEPVPTDAGTLRDRVHATHTAYLPTRHGEFRIHGYRDLRTGAEHVALVPTAGLSATPVVRVHSECLTGDAFGSARCDCGPQLDAALELAAEQGGVVVYLRGHEGRGIGLLAKVAAYALQDEGRDTVEANLDLGWPADRREYGAAAAILADLGAHRVRLLTNNPAKVAGLRAHGIDVAEVRGLEVGRTPHNEAYLRTKATSMGHLLHLPPGTQRDAIPVRPVLAAPASPGADTTDHAFESLEDLA